MRPNILMPIMIFMTRYYHNSNIPFRINSGFNHLYKFFRLTFYALSVFIVSSCEEGPTNIGAELLPGNDFVSISAIDTIKVSSYTMYDASIRTDNPSYSYLGQIYDAYFGTTTAEFVTQIRMAEKWDGKSYTLDSLKLCLKLLDVKGGAGVTHFLRLSEISELINKDSAYYSDKSVPLTGYEVKDIELPVLKPDTTNIIAVPLPIEFGNYLLRDTSKLFFSNTKPDFRSFFKGLYFRMYSSANPQLVVLSLQPPTSAGSYSNYFVLFMHDTAINKNASFNKFSHDFNTASAGKKIQHINDGYKDTLSYLQYLDGVYTRITIPGLVTLKNSAVYKNIAINKARLTVPVFFDGSLYKPSTVPAQLILRYKTKTGSKYVVPDYELGGLDQYHTFFDGKIDSTSNVYKFNIGTFVQQYLEDATGNILPELEIFQGAGTKNVIMRANSSKTPVKFDITYTKF
jgi:hypothetical protein